MRRRSVLLLLFAAIAASIDARSASAQKAPEEDEPALAVARVRRMAVRIPDRQFERWLFGNDGDTDTARRIAEARLRSRVSFIDDVCRLTRPQRKKLELAGRGDLKRFFDRVRVLRQQFRTAEDDLDRLARLIEDAEAEGELFRREFFGDETLFAKALRATLDADQAARYRRHWDEARLLRHQARVEWVTRTLQRSLAMSDGERLRLHAVLLEETRPPRDSGPADYYGIIYQASRIPEARLRPILDEVEWRLLRLEFDEARRREPELREAGLLPEDPPARDS
jgi:hypothetical protein